VRLRDVPKRELRRRAALKETGRIDSDIIRLDVFTRALEEAKRWLGRWPSYFSIGEALVPHWVTYLYRA
jgi:hypothetical protein